MPDQFLLDVDLSDEARLDDMVSELTASVLGHVGYWSAAVGETAASVHADPARGVADGLRRCCVQFRAHARDLEIVVRDAGRHEWRKKLR